MFVVWSDADVGTPEAHLNPEDARRVVARRTELMSETEAEIADVTVLVSKKNLVSEHMLNSMPNLQMISTWGVGYDHIDLEAATSAGIPVCINPVFTASMAEAALTLVLATGKRLRMLMEAMDRWHLEGQQDLIRLPEVGGSTVGIVGFGRIGQHLDAFLQALGADRLTYSPSFPEEMLPQGCQKVGLEELLRRSDWVVLTARLTPQTHHMMGKAQFERMKPTAILVNVGRGQLVDEKALENALRSGQIGGAGLDVWSKEPPDMRSPLLDFDNVIGTPHALGRSEKNVVKVQESIWANVEAVMNGRHPSNVVNPL